jgi:hypothetical protein
MFTPAYVNIVSYFYPIGNTPAICLTRDLSFEDEAKVLLLGCGDVRNILFTTYTDGACSTFLAVIPAVSLTLTEG